ncbi:type III secretion system ATPase SctN [Piscinibacter gummiphilus]|uniref:Type 3 secretion system ATPase n=1 Tax=Piscinibacter gummiphilus TaxID=946333 RepID=A0A1W6L8Y3_9BURK|nr:type III secretion system ATPase SctN [Piscinibacter gummiphilus]ARN20781.1 EscN/YscN/HrcN family type III secretion system ATPase [Piscinibacter gummiphilus]ATU65455.1 EscN/YscN/HrcN family type III secretion system ATPase [Piscinibacter gummiphilus]GLS94611.1 EscN/YscN/HrcN family type III secretion system ATPase [Piscinibacter gummiphilus]
MTDLLRFARALEDELQHESVLTRTGKVFEVVGTLIRASGLDVRVGELCELQDTRGRRIQRAEVVGFGKGGAVLSPFGGLTGVNDTTRVLGTGKPLSVRVGPGMLGRVISGLGDPIDGKGPIAGVEDRAVFADPPDPMSRAMIEHPLPTGVRIIDGLMTFGEGQRMGIFAPAGAGKSTLMGMLARGAQCDVSVIALIGERGREVREFIEFILGPEGMARSVVVCATSDRSSIERAKAAYVATAVAEYFRDQGQKVLLMMDSLTRFARAQREIGLAAGEPPARRGFPPSVFAELPRLLERTGMGARGSITALYTVLAEDESGGDPIAEEVRGILDGHMILSRRIAAKNQYPAIDVLGSLSRVMTQIVPGEHVAMASTLRSLMAKYDEVEMLLQVGEYKPGNDAMADMAVQRIEHIRAFLNQATSDLRPFDDTLAHLASLVQ